MATEAEEPPPIRDEPKEAEEEAVATPPIEEAPATPPPDETCRLCGETSLDAVPIFGDEGVEMGLLSSCSACLPVLVRRKETPCLLIVKRDGAKRDKV
jgi:hypothetical protein